MAGINPDSLHHAPRELPIWGLRVEVQQIIKRHAEVLQCAPDVVTASVFSTAATAMLRNLTIDTGKYQNPPIIWVCVVMPSSGNKSDPMKRIIEPLNRKDAEWYQEDKEKMMLHPNVTERQIMIEDTSAEGILDALAKNENGPGLFLARDEIKGMFDDVGRYNDSGIISHLLSIWDGKYVRINRKTQRRVVIEEPRLNIIGGIQNELVYDTFHKKGYTTSGFLPRWHFVCPEPVVEHYVDAVIEQNLIDEWAAMVEEMITMKPRVLTLSPEAKALYIDFFNKLQDLKPQADYYMQAVYGKLQIQVLRWCAVAHMLNSPESARLPSSDAVTENTMKYSIECMEYFLQDQKKVYDLINGGGGVPQITGEQLLVQVYQQYYNPNMTVQAFAKLIGKSHQYVSRIIQKAKAMLGHKNAKLQVAAEMDITNYEQDKYPHSARNLQPSNSSNYQRV